MYSVNLFIRQAGQSMYLSLKGLKQYANETIRIILVSRSMCRETLTIIFIFLQNHMERSRLPFFQKSLIHLPCLVCKLQYKKWRMFSVILGKVAKGQLCVYIFIFVLLLRSITQGIWRGDNGNSPLPSGSKREGIGLLKRGVKIGLQMVFSHQRNRSTFQSLFKV